MKPCNDCPFVRKNPLNGSPEWLADVLKFSKENKYFEHSCHKTDPKADGYKGSKKVVECKGHLQILINEIDNTPGKGGVYNSVNEMIKLYLLKWLGPAKLLEIKNASYFHLNKNRDVK